MRRSAVIVAAALALVHAAAAAQQATATPDPRIEQLIASVSQVRLERLLRTLVGFGTRNTLSDTLSPTRGIGAARRWIKSELDSISTACGGCLEVSYQRVMIAGEERIPDSTWVVSVVAVLRGSTDPDRYVIMTGDKDLLDLDPFRGIAIVTPAAHLIRGR